MNGVKKLFLFTVFAFCLFPAAVTAKESADTDNAAAEQALALETAVEESTSAAGNDALADNKKSKALYRLELEPFYGLKSGSLGEYVYKSSFSDAYKLSELNWNYTNESVLGVKAYGMFRNIFLGASFYGGIPGLYGKMLDSDWLNRSDISPYGTEYYNYKTRYSESYNYLREDFSLELKTGYVFNLNTFVRSISPFFSFEYDYVHFEGMNGTKWYGSYNGSHYLPYTTASAVSFADVVTGYTGYDIGYKRDTYYLWLGADFSFNPVKPLLINLEIGVAAYTIMYSTDIHYLNYNHIYYDLNGAYFNTFRCKLNVEWLVFKYNSINISGSVKYVPVEYGNTCTDSTYTVADGNSGASEWDVLFTASWKIYLP